MVTQESVGGHSGLLDLIGGNGLLGLGIFVYLFYVHFSNLSQYKNQILYKSSMVSAIVFLMMSFINPLFISSIGFILFAVPYLMCSPEFFPVSGES